MRVLFIKDHIYKGLLNWVSQNVEMKILQPTMNISRYDLPCIAIQQRIKTRKHSLGQFYEALREPYASRGHLHKLAIWRCTVVFANLATPRQRMAGKGAIRKLYCSRIRTRLIAAFEFMSPTVNFVYGCLVLEADVEISNTFCSLFSVPDSKKKRSRTTKVASKHNDVRWFSASLKPFIRKYFTSNLYWFGEQICSTTVFPISALKNAEILLFPSSFANPL